MKLAALKSRFGLKPQWRWLVALHVVVYVLGGTMAAHFNFDLTNWRLWLCGSAIVLVATTSELSIMKYWRPTSAMQPPTFVVAVLWLFAPAKQRDAIIGDLAELYRRNIAELGTTRATWIYCYDVLRSTGAAIFNLIWKLVSIYKMW